MSNVYAANFILNALPERLSSCGLFIEKDSFDPKATKVSQNFDVKEQRFLKLRNLRSNSKLFEL